MPNEPQAAAWRAIASAYGLRAHGIVGSRDDRLFNLSIREKADLKARHGDADPMMAQCRKPRQDHSRDGDEDTCCRQRNVGRQFAKSYLKATRMDSFNRLVVAPVSSSSGRVKLRFGPVTSASTSIGPCFALKGKLKGRAQGRPGCGPRNAGHTVRGDSLAP
jgi:hypothetical protein